MGFEIIYFQEGANFDIIIDSKLINRKDRDLLSAVERIEVLRFPTLCEASS